MRFSFVSILIVLCLTIALMGCGTPQVPVTGKVTVDGQPLTTGSVAYHPAGSKGDVETAVGRSQIDSSGSYTLMTGGKPGVPAGSYKVVVIAGGPSNPKDPYSLPVSLVDKKFTELSKTPLIVEVSPSAKPDTYDIVTTK